MGVEKNNKNFSQKINYIFYGALLNTLTIFFSIKIKMRMGCKVLHSEFYLFLFFTKLMHYWVKNLAFAFFMDV